MKRSNFYWQFRPDKAKTPTLFLHGFMGSLQSWGPLLNHLGPSGCFLVDLPGHGKSSDEPVLPAQTLFETLHHLLKVHKINKINVVGYSMGGRLATGFTQQFPEQVEKLVLISSSLGNNNENERQERILLEQKWQTELAELPFETFLQNWYDMPLFQTFAKHPQFQFEITRRLKENKPKNLIQVLKYWGQGQPDNTKSFIQNIPIPLLYLAGSLDPKYARIADELGKYPNPLINTKILPNAGHVLHIEAAEACAKEIHPFLNAPKS